MRAEIQIVVDASDEDELTGLRQRAHDTLGEYTRVSSSSAGFTDDPYTVLGAIKGKPLAHWVTVVRAQDEATAKEIALAEDDKRTVVAVVKGDISAQVEQT